MHPRVKYDPVVLQQRLERKRLAREADDRAFASGEKSAEQLNRENDHFGRLRIRIDCDSGKVQY